MPIDDNWRIITVNTGEVVTLKSEIICDLTERYRMSQEEAKQATNEFDIDALVAEYPFHVRHYSIEMITDGVWRRFKDAHK